MNEKLSALMDGALEESSARSTIETAGRDAGARDVWRTYHLIGDALRGEHVADFDCCAKVLAALESEPTVLAPVARRAASNSRMRWALPLAASVVGVGAVGWVAQSVNKTSTPTVVVMQPAANSVQTASLPVPAGVQGAVVASVPVTPVVPVSGNFAREYLIAHQAQSPSANMAGVAQYVRTVSESRQEQAR